MEIPARHVRKGDCIIRDVVPGGRVLVFVDYPDLGLTHRPACLDELVDRRTGGPISLDAPPAREAPAAAASALPPWQRARSIARRCRSAEWGSFGLRFRQRQ